MARGHDGGVVLVLEGGAAEVDEADLAAARDALRRGAGALVRRLLVVLAADEEDVLRFQVRVDEAEAVEDCRQRCGEREA